MNQSNNRTPFFDVHCHFFNKEILSLRLLVELGMVLSQRREQNDAAVADSVSAVTRVLHFLKTGVLRVEKIYASLEKEENGFAFCPLMFDLEGSLFSVEATDAVNNESVEQQLIREVNSLLTSGTEEEEELRELLGQWSELANVDQVSYSHFEGQEKQLKSLAQQYPGRIFPFFAVDPRRSELFDNPKQKKGIEKIVARLAINGGTFSGIKLYAPNGYSPADERLLPLYEYCEAHQVPVTAHCSAGGFATLASSLEVQGLIYENGKVVSRKGIYRFNNNGLFNGRRVAERAEVLNHPQIWNQVLKVFPRLKLDLAHFGSQDSGRKTEWTDCIWEMMHRYPNLYTDFSCIADETELQHMHEHYFKKAAPEVKARFMYGSDYYLNLLFCSGIKAFLHNFSRIFSPEEWTTIARENPARFLQTERG